MAQGKADSRDSGVSPSVAPVSPSGRLDPSPLGLDLPMKPWHEYDKPDEAVIALLHEIARDQNQQYSEACRKAKAYLTKFNRWETV